jgi:hypothetical protein
LKQFLTDVSLNLMNRASQREKISFKIYETYKNERSGELFENLPETIGRNRSLIPDETFVLIGYYREENWEWIIKHGLYNVRAGTSRGSLRLRPEEVGAKYILLHSENEIVTGKILKVKEIGPRVFSKEDLLRLNYPSPDPQDYYLVYTVQDLVEPELQGYKWDLRMLEGFKFGRGSALPFAISIAELMKGLAR